MMQNPRSERGPSDPDPALGLSDRIHQRQQFGDGLLAFDRIGRSCAQRIERNRLVDGVPVGGRVASTRLPRRPTLSRDL
jgi:hypothetical protein